LTFDFFAHFASGTSVGTSMTAVNAASYIEETVSNGFPYILSSILQLMDDPDSGAQKVGVKFDRLVLPKQASIVYATIQFTCNQPSWASTVVRINADVSTVFNM
jgi:hypothetical protein